MLHATLRELAPGLMVHQTIPAGAIDGRVLTALLAVARYKHGVRSLRAIIEMSTLVGRSRFVAADLPSDEHLALHVSQDFAEKLRDG